MKRILFLLSALLLAGPLFAQNSKRKTSARVLDSAIAFLRSDPEYSDPQYWAAFIMLD